MINWTQAIEMDMERWVLSPPQHHSSCGCAVCQSDAYMKGALAEMRRLREELREEWTHREYRCPCSDKQRGRDQKPAPWQECTCGLTEALWDGT